MYLFFKTTFYPKNFFVITPLFFNVKVKPNFLLINVYISTEKVHRNFSNTHTLIQL